MPPHKRRSVHNDPALNKSVEESLNELEESINKNDADIEGKRGSWQKVVTEELKSLDEVQDEQRKHIEEMQQQIDQSSTLQSHMDAEIANIRQDFNEKLDALTEQFKIYKLEASKENAWLQEQIKLLGTENDVLINKNQKLMKEQDALKQRIGENEKEVLHLRNQLSNEIETTLQAAEDNQKALEHRTESLQKYVQNLSRGRISGAGELSATDSARRLGLKSPKFKGESKERPIRFLNDLKRYLDVTQPNDSELKYVLAQALDDAAQSWYALHENDVQDFETFEEKFKEQYWNDDLQRTARRKLEFGRYESKGKMTRTEYAIELFNIARELDERRQDADIITQLTLHFEREVRGALRSQAEKTKTAFFNVLSSFDNDDTHERKNNRNLYNSNEPKAYNNNNNNNNNNNDTYGTRKDYQHYNNNNNNASYNRGRFQASDPSNKSKLYTTNSMRMEAVSKGNMQRNKKQESRQMGAIPKLTRQAYERYEKEIDVLSLTGEASGIQSGNGV